MKGLIFCGGSQISFGIAVQNKVCILQRNIADKRIKL